jgi:hypothetical protein
MGCSGLPVQSTAGAAPMPAGSSRDSPPGSPDRAGRPSSHASPRR